MGKVFVKYHVQGLQMFVNISHMQESFKKGGGRKIGKTVGYARVSSREQNLDRQIVALRQFVPEEMIVADKASGKDFNRAGYQSLKVGIGKLVKGGHIVYQVFGQV